MLPSLGFVYLDDIFIIIFFFMLIFLESHHFKKVSLIKDVPNKNNS